MSDSPNHKSKYRQSHEGNNRSSNSESINAALSLATLRLEALKTLHYSEETKHDLLEGVKARKTFGLPPDAPNVELNVLKGAQDLIDESKKLGLPVITLEQSNFLRDAQADEVHRKQLGLSLGTTTNVIREKYLDRQNAIQNLQRAFEEKNQEQEKLDPKKKLADLKHEIHDLTKSMHLPENISLKETQAKQSALDKELAILPQPKRDSATVQKVLNMEVASTVRRRLHLSSEVPDAVVIGIENQWQTLENKYGVHIIHLSATHKEIRSASSNPRAEKKLFEFDVDKNQISTAHHGIEAYIATKELELSKKFNCTFSHPGEVIQKQKIVHHDGTTEATNRDVTARMPTVKELLGIEAALSRYYPNGQKADKNGIRFNFLSEADQVDENKQANDGADYGQSIINICPNSQLATQAELSNVGKFEDSPGTMEGVIDHELSHDKQYKLGWWSGKRASTIPRALHWATFKQHPHDYDWYLIGKDGFLYKYDVLYEKHGGSDIPEKQITWIKCNQQGEPTYANDAARTRNIMSRISNDEMRKLAVEKPVTHYFPYPPEMHAEASLLFCSGPEYRRRLFLDNPELYRIIAKQDKEYIFETYGSISGKANDARPKYLRDIDGLLKPNTQVLQAKIVLFEKTALAESKTYKERSGKLDLSQLKTDSDGKLVKESYDEVLVWLAQRLNLEHHYVVRTGDTLKSISTMLLLAENACWPNQSEVEAKERQILKDSNLDRYALRFKKDSRSNGDWIYPNLILNVQIPLNSAYLED